MSELNGGFVCNNIQGCQACVTKPAQKSVQYQNLKYASAKPYKLLLSPAALLSLPNVLKYLQSNTVNVYCTSIKKQFSRVKMSDRQ